MQRWGLSREILLLLFITCISLSCDQNSHSHTIQQTYRSLSSPPKAVQLQEIAEQEFWKTRDPRLNVVPKERLKSAYGTYTRRIQEKREVNRGAIGGISWTERGPDNVGGRTRAILIDANDVTNETAWVGSVSGGALENNEY